MLVCAFLLAGLAIADRTIAWMIGQYPTSAALWELRFEYLRPIGVFHDIAVRNLGSVPVGAFNLAALGAALAVGLGALSPIRLVRALSCHLLLGAALVIAVYSFDPGEGIYAEVGVPSGGYLLFGALLVVLTAIKCASAHAEYVGWNPASSPAARRAKRALARLGAAGRGIVAELLDQAMPTPSRAQAIFVRARRASRTGVVR